MRDTLRSAVGLGALSRRLAIPLALAFALAPVAAIAHDYTLGNLRIEHPYARPTPPGARTAGAYFTVRNAGKAADRLLQVFSPVAQTVEDRKSVV